MVSDPKIHIRKGEIIQVRDVEDIEIHAHVLNCNVGTLSRAYLGSPLGASNKDRAAWNLAILLGLSKLMPHQC